MNITLFDTIHTPLSSFSVVPDTILVSLILDTNTVDLNCVINTTQTTTDVLTINVSSIGLIEKPIAYFTIHPNPATTELQLKNLLGSNVLHIKLLSSTGQFIKNYAPTSSVLSLNGLLPGYYILEIAISNRVVRKKIIIN